MIYKWREVTQSGGRLTCYLDVPASFDRFTRNVGFVERLGPTRFNACDMNNSEWLWREFDNLHDAKRWLEVTARMTHAS